MRIWPPKEPNEAAMAANSEFADWFECCEAVPEPQLKVCQNPLPAQLAGAGDVDILSLGEAMELIGVRTPF